MKVKDIRKKRLCIENYREFLEGNDDSFTFYVEVYMFFEIDEMGDSPSFRWRDTGRNAGKKVKILLDVDFIINNDGEIEFKDILYAEFSRKCALSTTFEYQKNWIKTFYTDDDFVYGCTYFVDEIFQDDEEYQYIIECEVLEHLTKKGFLKS